MNSRYEKKYTWKMKKLSIILMAILFAMPMVSMGQNSKNSKEVSPFIDGKLKVRMADYDSIWKFTTFDQKTLYYCNYDYSVLPSTVDARHPEWGRFTPVMNFLSTQARTPMRIVAVYAINPEIKDASRREQLSEIARQEALASLQSLQQWMAKEEMKNKLQLFVAQVDHRYWQGNDFFVNPQPKDDIIHVGLILFFGTKKIDMFPSAAAGAKEFNNVKFFPNDATVQVSYNSLLDELAQYMLENERFEVMLRGYTDNVGTEAYCVGLSRQRATEVKKLLIARGVPEYRIEIEAKGSADPIGDNDDYEGRISNNRVSITIQ